MKRRDLEREIGGMFLDACSMVSKHPEAEWCGVMEEGFTEVCKVVGVMLYVDPHGYPTDPGFVLESRDGKRLYTCTRARIFVPEVPA
jgi:hypothetical protein